MWIEPEIFTTIVQYTPLVSIDMVVRNKVGQVLLGKRTNRPAKGSWFVPGGRINKNEKMEDAFDRILIDELGESISFSNARFLGTYQHFYTDYFGGADISTHYVVLAYELSMDIAIDSLPREQHSDYRWVGVQELRAAQNVHHHTKNYFI